MTEKVLHNKQSLRFRKWSRDSYAVFASIGRVVSIGALTTSASQWISVALNQLDRDLAELLKITLEEDENDLSEQELIDLMPLLVTADDECEKIIYIKLKYNRR